MSIAASTLQLQVNRLELVGTQIASICGNEPFCAVSLP
jgi:hypothetical protein